ncbi:MAG: acyl-CoA/acyl-ACP dehydrogenase [Myxococcales bacterium]|nr:acyl-CoA/acyl-ACP dehydrogenase [Myxococcales bacterium]
MTEARHLATIEKIATDVVAEHAVSVDKNAEFPTQSMAALAEAGLLGLVSATSVGGMGLGMRAAAEVVERLARECGSTAMVTAMHYAAVQVIEQHGPEDVRKQIAAGKHLTTLAFSELGSRSQFWAPVSAAVEDGKSVKLTARKSWVTSAHAAQSYVWSSKPLAAAEASTIWLVPADTKGLRVTERFDGMGLRGNDSAPITAEDARIDAKNMLGSDGAGFKLMLEVVLPWFNLLNAACSLGLMEAAVARTALHATATGFEHSGSRVADLPTVRAYLARMRVKTDAVRGLLLDTLDALEKGRPDAVLRVLEIKAFAGETATEVTDLGMRVAGGAAFRKEVGVERVFRDARAASVMAPTTDVLYEFIGKAVCNMPLF